MFPPVFLSEKMSGHRGRSTVFRKYEAKDVALKHVAAQIRKELLSWLFSERTVSLPTRRSSFRKGFVFSVSQFV